MITCNNSSCKKTFSVPLKTLNLQEETKEHYLACPYCLTKVDEINNTLSEGTHVQEKVIQAVNTYLADSASTQDNDEKIECKFHLGYLSERTQKEQIPDECYVCKDMVSCMLKKVNE